MEKEQVERIRPGQLDRARFVEDLAEIGVIVDLARWHDLGDLDILGKVVARNSDQLYKISELWSINKNSEVGNEV